MTRACLRHVLNFLSIGLVLSCGWKPLPDDVWQVPSFEAGAKQVAEFDISDPEACRQRCCSQPLCSVALLGYPMDTTAKCILMGCIGGCQLESSSQFEVVGVKQPPIAVPLDGNSPPVRNERLAEPSTNTTIACHQPMKVGSCRAAFPKFYYDIANQTCRSFTYGGCEANGNNFDSLEDCEATCNGVTGSVLPDESAATTSDDSVKSVRMAQIPSLNALTYEDDDDDVKDKVISAEEYSERCEAEPMVGPCRAAFRHWYYDSLQGQCKAFIYGGCKGNKNNYRTQKSCLDACLVSVVPAPKKLLSPDSSSDIEEECLASPDSGPCRAAFPKFYYDPSTDSCQSFIYGGCLGNKNRYSSAEDCQSRCSGAADGFLAGREKSRSRWTTTFFVLLTLAAICTLLVSALVVTVLRRLRVSRRASIVSDKEELLPDVRSSFESLNVPTLPTVRKA
ncbi:kunitz-type protease inhibitor 2 [Syngnathus typhle]|uniref:kunitz-type protease inhibitor 2 n=1 Tax=Syngnathus typhle TaxID=161592 RepID=UPI002A69C1B4|nr:kunitz-type protease inhibitor 2 [Syngnathus typhle]